MICGFARGLPSVAGASSRIGSALRTWLGLGSGVGLEGASLLVVRGGVDTGPDLTVGRDADLRALPRQGERDRGGIRDLVLHRARLRGRRTEVEPLQVCLRRPRYASGTPGVRLGCCSGAPGASCPVPVRRARRRPARVARTCSTEAPGRTCQHGVQPSARAPSEGRA